MAMKGQCKPSKYKTWILDWIMDWTVDWTLKFYFVKKKCENDFLYANYMRESPN